jgi:D-alanyl-D-alanine carboxypeptidase
MNRTEPARAAARPARAGILAAAAALSVALVGVAAWPIGGAVSPVGAVLDGVTVLDDNRPTVANLDPALLGALRRAAAQAALDRVEIVVNSGWRSRQHQERLLQEAVSKYGSLRQAARWVATPDTSPHVSGNAVDVGPSDAAVWLSEHGAAFGLCQIYGNEPWHFELRPQAIAHGCPPRYADPMQDPRMQRPATQRTASPRGQEHR